MSRGKYHSASYSKPAAALKKTRIRVSLSVMAFSDSSTAARAIIPTVAALRPDRRAYASEGKVDPILETPIESAYIPSAPGRLGHYFCCRTLARSVTYLQTKKLITAL